MSKKDFNIAFESIEKQYGKGSIMFLGDDAINQTIPKISTGSINLDLALGIGGVPKGRIIEIFGPESSGKTTLALHILAEAQKAGGMGAFIDVEHALDPIYANSIGVNIKKLAISQPDTGEQALDIVETLVRSNCFSVVVVDSVAALVPKAEITGEMGDSHMGLQARLMSQAMRKLTGAISKSNTCVIFINQIRMKIGIVFGNPETTPGGNALKFYSTIRLDIRRICQLKSKAQIIGAKTKVKVVKNKIAPPFKIAEFDLIYGKGISQAGEIVDLGTELEIFEVAGGGWYTYKEEKIAHGRDQFVEKLNNDQKLFDKIKKEVMSKILKDK